jgi:hypothetical protein
VARADILANVVVLHSSENSIALGGPRLGAEHLVELNYKSNLTPLVAGARLCSGSCSPVATPPARQSWSPAFAQRSPSKPDPASAVPRKVAVVNLAQSVHGPNGARTASLPPRPSVSPLQPPGLSPMRNRQGIDTGSPFLRQYPDLRKNRPCKSSIWLHRLCEFRDRSNTIAIRLQPF